MNNQNRPKANYHLLATVATLGLVRGGICSDKSLRTRSEATQGVWGIRSPVPPRGLSRSDWGVKRNAHAVRSDARGLGNPVPSAPRGLSRSDWGVKKIARSSELRARRCKEVIIRFICH